jgi:hypothetical protein
MRYLLFGLSALLLAAAALPARACINDREVNRAEREFKSQYLQPAPTISEPSPPESRAVPIALLGGGGFLVLGATLTVLNVRRRPGHE